MIAGLAALAEAHSHRPPPSFDLKKELGGGHILGILTLTSRDTGWSRTTYDIVHIAGAALLILGALLMIVGLLALARRANGPQAQ